MCIRDSLYVKNRGKGKLVGRFVPSVKKQEADFLHIAEVEELAAEERKLGFGGKEMATDEVEATSGIVEQAVAEQAATEQEVKGQNGMEQAAGVAEWDDRG